MIFPYVLVSSDPNHMEEAVESRFRFINCWRNKGAQIYQTNFC